MQGGRYSTATVTAVHEETVDLSVKIALNAKFDALKPPLLSPTRETIAVDTKVQYQYEDGGMRFFPATVKVVRDDGTFDIIEDGNETHDSVVISRLFVRSDALDQASLQKGSQVRYGGVRVAVVKEVKEDGECAANYARTARCKLPHVCRYVRSRRRENVDSLQPSSRSRDRVNHHGLLTHVRVRPVGPLPLRS